ncbi:MAG: hypothetical protein A2W91_17685 [Bacteroidetes bacterium GWF2_38_335]|nr:MAG: hypothetical protein A2W91_17685 [Bacteroidetes bacterium GWF2_38_335]OFY78034.1 MAG: hypothetical protein A2281_18775 [Bacteroidetes bacterium RIFOXYA12_FULL_38_20]HBS88306.1 hypothetical protein [Bacteroidales bacterium]
MYFRLITYKILKNIPFLKSRFSIRYLLTGMIILSLTATMQNCRSKKVIHCYVGPPENYEQADSLKQNE